MYSFEKNEIIMIDNKVIIFMKVNLYFQKYLPKLIVLDKISFKLIKQIMCLFI